MNSFSSMTQFMFSAFRAPLACKPLLAAVFSTFVMLTARAQDDDSDFAVYFPIGISKLSPVAQKTLDSLVYRGAIQPGQRLTITGYADEPGTTALNNSLSQRRAQAVADYLTRDGFIKKEDIAAVSGRGYDREAAGRGNNPRYRRASIAVSDGPPRLRPTAVVPPTPQSPPPPPPPTRTVLPRLDTMKTNSTLTLDAVLFENDSDAVLPSSVGQLAELLNAMRENPTVRIRLEGHVCCRATNEHGRYISTIRAKAVYNYLLRNGISESRLAYEGFGFSRPKFDPELSEEHRTLNRRVEVRIVQK